MSEPSSLAEELLFHAAQLDQQQQLAAFGANTFVRVLEPAVLCSLLRRAAAALTTPANDPALPPVDQEPSEFFRVYAWAEGRVLTAADIRDVQTVLAEYNDEMGKQADLFHEARMVTLREIGGEALVEAIAADDKSRIDRIVRRAMAKVAEETEKRRREVQ